MNKNIAIMAFLMFYGQANAFFSESACKAICIPFVDIVNNKCNSEIKKINNEYNKIISYLQNEMDKQKDCAYKANTNISKPKYNANLIAESIGAGIATLVGPQAVCTPTCIQNIHDARMGCKNNVNSVINSFEKTIDDLIVSINKQENCYYQNENSGSNSDDSNIGNDTSSTTDNDSNNSGSNSGSVNGNGNSSTSNIYNSSSYNSTNNANNDNYNLEQFTKFVKSKSNNHNPSNQKNTNQKIQKNSLTIQKNTNFYDVIREKKRTNKTIIEVK